MQAREHGCGWNDQTCSAAAGAFVLNAALYFSLLPPPCTPSLRPSSTPSLHPLLPPSILYSLLPSRDAYSRVLMLCVCVLDMSGAGGAQRKYIDYCV